MLITKQFETFALNAANYCSLIESDFSGQDNFIDTLQVRLLSLYQEAFQLPEVFAIEECNSQISDFDFEQYVPKLSRLLEFQFYWLVLDPLNHENVQTGCGDILDDLRDIYKDLKRELYYLNSTNDACTKHGYWLVKWDFDNHWGEHCINALTAIHHFKRNI